MLHGLSCSAACDIFPDKALNSCPLCWRASVVAQMVKWCSGNLPTMQETQVQFLCLEDPLKEGTATHSSILAWRIPWAEEPGGPESMGLKRVGHD